MLFYDIDRKLRAVAAKSRTSKDDVLCYLLGGGFESDNVPRQIEAAIRDLGLSVEKGSIE
ncbi:MAG TPA: hypothetical protein VHM25_28865 [Polyangiaceae bacterium]|jgi:hypothetical protein|nr:hypothetical protein [Polyangiaceae bacterium]